jgi:hypothetical protein
MLFSMILISLAIVPPRGNRAHQTKQAVTAAAFSCLRLRVCFPKFDDRMFSKAQEAFGCGITVDLSLRTGEDFYNKDKGHTGHTDLQQALSHWNRVTQKIKRLGITFT